MAELGIGGLAARRKHSIYIYILYIYIYAYDAAAGDADDHCFIFPKTHLNQIRYSKNPFSQKQKEGNSLLAKVTVTCFHFPCQTDVRCFYR